MASTLGKLAWSVANLVTFVPLPERFYKPGWNYDNYVRCRGSPRHAVQRVPRSAALFRDAPRSRPLQALYPLIEQSPCFTNDTSLARFHIIRHRENWKEGEGVEVVEWMRANYALGRRLPVRPRQLSALPLLRPRD
jgi:hypothetical protein